MKFDIQLYSAFMGFRISGMAGVTRSVPGLVEDTASLCQTCLVMGAPRNLKMPLNTLPRNFALI